MWLQSLQLPILIVYVLFKMQEEPDEDSQCLSDDTDIEISTQVRVRLFLPLFVRFHFCP